MKSLSFVIKASVLGLIAALAILLFLLPREQVVVTPTTTPAAPNNMQGPVSYADAVAKAAPSVVNISTSKTVREPSNRSLFEQLFRNTIPRDRIQKGLGSGVIFSKQGYIVTNYHVIHDADNIKVFLRDGRQEPAKVVGSDPEADLAILKIGLSNLDAISIGQSDKLRVGDVVLAIGNPFGVGQAVTMGIVSATGRDHLGVNTFENFIQTDAAINPGNSGGALVNAYGDLIGINTAIFSQSGGSDGIGFAIPVDMVTSILKQIVEHGRVVRGWLGVEAVDIQPQLAKQYSIDGVIITGIYRNGPADKAGIQLGDVISEVNNQAIQNTRALLKVISGSKPNTDLNIKFWREGKTLNTVATVNQRPPIQP